MKKNIFRLGFLLWISTNLTQAQVTLNAGCRLTVPEGTMVTLQDLVHAGGVINNQGEMGLTGNLINNQEGIFDSGSSGTVRMSGTTTQEITGPSSVFFYGVLNINNPAGVALTNTITGANPFVMGSLTFTLGKLTLNGFDLTMGSGIISGTGTDTYIQANGTGKLRREVPADGFTTVDFPVGNSSYNPLTLLNSASATTDTFAVRIIDSNPVSFSGTTHIVDRSWEVTEMVTGGSNLTLSVQWNQDEELDNFDRSLCSIGLTQDNGQNVNWGNASTASGSDPYTQTTSGISETGTLMVGDYYYSGLIIDLQAFLAGAYNSTHHNLDKTLNALLPLTDPYGLSTTVSSVPVNAVDWVKIELRSGTDRAAVLYSFARFIDQDGQIINQDGTHCKMTGVTAGSYYVAIVHRNHFGIVSNNTVNLSDAPSLSFKGDQSNAWQNASITTNAAMKEVETGVFALWDGDANQDGQVAYNGAANDRSAVLTEVGVSTPGNTILSTYSAYDVNMDGDVIYNGADSDRTSILSVVGVTTPGAVLTAHLPE